MVEQWTENPCVGSSILPSTTETRWFSAGFVFHTLFHTLFWRFPFIASCCSVLLFRPGHLVLKRPFLVVYRFPHSSVRCINDLFVLGLITQITRSVERRVSPHQLSISPLAYSSDCRRVENWTQFATRWFFGVEKNLLAASESRWLSVLGICTMKIHWLFSFFSRSISLSFLLFPPLSNSRKN